MKTIKFKYYRILKRLGFEIPKYIVLEYAKLLYINEYKNDRGMCYVLNIALIYYYIDSLPRYIFDKFNYSFCADKPFINTFDNYTTYWWKLDNTKDRIKAFDKLIKYYKEHKEYI